MESVVNYISSLCIVSYLVIYPIAWGMNEELTDDEVASIVISTRSFLVNEALRRKLKLYFAYVATFPFYYLLHSWKK